MRVQSAAATWCIQWLAPAPIVNIRFRVERGRGPSVLTARRREPAPTGRASSGRAGRDHHGLVQCPASLRGDLLPGPDDIVFELGLR